MVITEDSGFTLTETNTYKRTLKKTQDIKIYEYVPQSLYPFVLQ